jgi:2-oxoglutarate ferredoxin oxidoreductase subunit beta
VLHTPDFILGSQEITVDYEPGTVQEIAFDNGNRVLLRKLDRDYDPSDRIEAMRVMHEARDRGELVTGLLYVDTNARDLCERERLPQKPLAQMNEDDLRISREDWATLMAV